MLPNRDELLSGFVDGELSAAERQQVETILASESTAQARLHEVRQVRNELKSLPKFNLPNNFRDTIVARIGGAVPLADSAAVESGGLMPVPALVGINNRPASRTLFWLAVAASLLLCAVPFVGWMKNSLQPQEEAVARQYAEQLTGNALSEGPMEEEREKGVRLREFGGLAGSPMSAPKLQPAGDVDASDKSATRFGAKDDSAQVNLAQPFASRGSSPPEREGGGYGGQGGLPNPPARRQSDDDGISAPPGQKAAPALPAPPSPQGATASAAPADGMQPIAPGLMTQREFADTASTPHVVICEVAAPRDFLLFEKALASRGIELQDADTVEEERRKESESSTGGAPAAGQVRGGADRSGAASDDARTLNEKLSNQDSDSYRVYVVDAPQEQLRQVFLQMEATQRAEVVAGWSMAPGDNSDLAELAQTNQDRGQDRLRRSVSGTTADQQSEGLRNQLAASAHEKQMPRGRAVPLAVPEPTLAQLGKKQGTEKRQQQAKGDQELARQPEATAGAKQGGVREDVTSKPDGKGITKDEGGKQRPREANSDNDRTEASLPGNNRAVDSTDKLAAKPALPKGAAAAESGEGKAATNGQAQAPGAAGSGSAGAAAKNAQSRVAELAVPDAVGKKLQDEGPRLARTIVILRVNKALEAHEKAPPAGTAPQP